MELQTILFTCNCQLPISGVKCEVLNVVISTQLQTTTGCDYGANGDTMLVQV